MCTAMFIDHISIKHIPSFIKSFSDIQMKITLSRDDTKDSISTPM